MLATSTQKQTMVGQQANSMDYPNDMKHDDGQHDEPGFPMRRRRRTRTVFTSESIALMEEQFNRNRYPDIIGREYLAEQIGVSEARVQVWFQNRRARSNKQTDHGVTKTDSKRETEDTYYSGSGKLSKQAKLSRETIKRDLKSEHDIVPSANRMTSDAAVRAYINQHQMYFPFKHVSPYIRNPFLAYLPVNHYPRAPDIHLKSPPLSLYPDHKRPYSSNREEDYDGDNIVQRLFRFSSPSYHEKVPKSAEANDLKHIFFPRISLSKYSMASGSVEDDGVSSDYTSDLEHSQRISESRDPFQTELFKDDSAPSSLDGSEVSDFGSVST